LHIRDIWRKTGEVDYRKETQMNVGLVLIATLAVCRCLWDFNERRKTQDRYEAQRRALDAVRHERNEAMEELKRVVAINHDNYRALKAAGIIMHDHSEPKCTVSRYDFDQILRDMDKN
jgi:hypothetical protein